MTLAQADECADTQTMSVTRRSHPGSYPDPCRSAPYRRWRGLFRLRVARPVVTIGLVLTVAACSSGVRRVSNSTGTTTQSETASIPTLSAPPTTTTLAHLVPQPIPPDLQLVDPQSDPLDPIVLSVQRYAQLYAGPHDSLLYIDAEASQPANWARPTPGPGETLVQLPAGPGILTVDSANADQVLFNRIGTVFDNRVPSPRAGGSILLWTDRTLDYYGVTLNVAHGEQLLRGIAAEIRPARTGTFTLSSPDPTLSLRFSGDPSQQWRSPQVPLNYGFASNAVGEIDITITHTQPGFVEALLGSPTVTINGHSGWLLASQPSLESSSYTLFWHETPEEMVILTSDGHLSMSGLLTFANSLRPTDEPSWANLAKRISTP